MIKFCKGPRITITPAPILTCIGFPSTIWPGGRSPVPGLHLQGEGALRLSVEDLLGEHLAGLGVDLEAVLALVPDAVHDVVVDLVVGEGAVLVYGVYPAQRGVECIILDWD